MTGTEAEPSGTRRSAAGPHTRWLWLLGAAGAVLTVHTGWHVALAAWLFGVFLLRYARLTAPRRGLFRVGLAIGLSVIVWMGATILLFVPSVWAAFGLLIVLQTAPFVADRLLVSRSAGLLGGLPGTLVFPVVTVTGEFLFRLVTQFGDYGALGSTQHGVLPLIQLSSVTGVYGVSFVVAWFASVANWAWGRDFRWSVIRRNVAIYLGVLALVLVAGGVRLLFFAPTTHTVRVAGISASASAEAASTTALKGLDADYWRPHDLAAADPAAVRGAFAPVSDDLVAATARAARAGAKIIVWPETDAEIRAADLPALMNRVTVIARRANVYIDVGFALYTGQEPYVRNVTKLVTPRGRVAWTYDKTHPTPMEPMEPGDGNVPIADSAYGRLANVICYDADFPGLMRQAAGKDTAIMLVPANDWPGFANLHAQKAVFRAVANGYTIVRQSVHGVSTAVDAQGRILARADYYTTDRQTMVAAVPVQPRVGTVYGAVGDVFAWLCVAATGVLIAAGVLRRSRVRAGHGDS